MTLAFLQLPADEHRVYIDEAAARRGLAPVIVEKDFSNQHVSSPLRNRTECPLWNRCGVLCFASQVVSRSHDCDSAERIQIEEVFITGHDHVCAPVYGRFEELVILRITRRANRLQYIDDFDE